MNAILAALVNGLLVSTGLAFATWVAVRLTPRSSLNAATRYAIWWVILVATVTVPVYYFANAQSPGASNTAPIPRVILSSAAADQEKLTTESGTKIQPPLSPETMPPPFSTPSRHLAPSTFTITISARAWPARIVLFWFACAALMLARLIFGAIALERRKARATECPRTISAGTGTNRRIRIACSPEISVPMACGPWRPSILLPARYITELNQTDLEQIMIHEAAHLIRYDDYRLVVQRVLQALFVLHPVVHWLSRRIDLEREIACDDFVVTATGRARSFAACLTRIVELSGGIRATPLAAAVVDRSHLARRVEMLLDARRPTGTGLLWVRLAFAAAAIAAMGWGSVLMPGFISLRNSGPDPEVRNSLQKPTSPAITVVAQAERPTVPIGRSMLPSTQPVPTDAATSNAAPAPVLVSVDVRDPLGRFVTGLDQSIFTIREDGAEQSITGMADLQDRAHLFLLVDSGVNPEPVIRPLLEERVEIGQNDDVVQIHGFGVLEVNTSPLTALQMIQRRLPDLVGRKAALIVTNSLGDARRYTDSDIANAPKTVDMPVYVIDLSGLNPQAPVSGVVSPQAFFRELASRTGGNYIAANSQEEVPDLVARIEIAVRNMYVLSYMPRNAVPDGKYRRLEISLKQPRGLPPLTAHYRPGYIVPAR